MKEWMTRVALEIIGQSGLGYSFETLDESKSNQYAIAVKMLLCVIITIVVHFDRSTNFIY